MEQRAMAVRERNWAQSIRMAGKSGMSQKDWCVANGIAPSTFYRWKRILKDKILAAEDARGSSTVCFAKIEPPERSDRGARDSQTIRMRVQEITLEISADCTEEQLCKMLRAVRHAW